VLARALRYAVAGLSMAAGLGPDDVVVTASFPRLTIGRAPRRFERRVVRGDFPSGSRDSRHWGRWSAVPCVRP
jgi:hypothetical protein